MVTPRITTATRASTMVNPRSLLAWHISTFHHLGTEYHNIDQFPLGLGHNIQGGCAGRKWRNFEE
jgi:hypothetical protein